MHRRSLFVLAVARYDLIVPDSGTVLIVHSALRTILTSRTALRTVPGLTPELSTAY